jgi:asparagine synthase (glutamine-hydrolysing)
MLCRIVHRGPDDSGQWRDHRWHLGMTRLAIIDLETGRQPMRSADGRWVMVFNGEIYNFPDLARLITDRGVHLRTRSDTEVLVELIAARGVPAALEKAEGMFAFAVADTLTGDLWLARDRFGEKPLYLDRRQGSFAFCSELGPLIQERTLSARPSARGVVAIFRYGYPWAGTTAVDGIEELPPAHWLRRTADGAETLGAYWSLPDRVDEEAGSLQRCGERILELLDASVRARLIADVPLGLFLSGGIDSSAVAASAVRHRPDIQAVTVGFDAGTHDERPLARLTASQLGIVLREEQGRTAPFSPEGFDDVLSHHGQPFMDTSAFPTRALSHLARRNFKVVLSGDGGDELFSGYPAHTRNELLRILGGGRLGSALSGLLARVLPEQGTFESLRRALDLNASCNDGLALHVMDGTFTDRSLLELVQGSDWESATRAHLQMARENAYRLWSTVKDSNLAFSLHQIRTSLPQDILMKVDRMSMAESLEVRAPFLDSKLAAYALSLPARLKVRGRVGKYVLRHALHGRVPQAVLDGPKRGFNLPVRLWMGDRFWQELASEAELYQRVGASELNAHALLRQIALDRERCRRANNYRALHRAFVLYSFLRWRRCFLREGQPQALMPAAAAR